MTGATDALRILVAGASAGIGAALVQRTVIESSPAPGGSTCCAG